MDLMELMTKRVKLYQATLSIFLAFGGFCVDAKASLLAPPFVLLLTLTRPFAPMLLHIIYISGCVLKWQKLNK